MTAEMKAGIAGALVTAVLSVPGSYFIFRLITPTPKITIAITQPQQDPGAAKVRQFVTVTNSSEVVAKAVNFELKSVGARLERSSDGSISGLEVIFAPPRLQMPTPICANDGNCIVAIGDLQPNTYATFKISYVAPQLREDEIETYSDNAKTSKVVSRLQQP